MPNTIPINASANFVLGDASPHSVGRIVFQVVEVSAISTSFVVKARVPGLADTELIAVPYTNRGTGAAVAASTAITAEGLFEVDATGVEIVLVNTYTSGKANVTYFPVAG